MIADFVSGAEKRQYFKFDLRSIPPNSTITSATLNYYWYQVSYSYSQVYTLKRVADSSWTQGGITWNNAPAATSTTTTYTQNNLSLARTVTADVIASMLSRNLSYQVSCSDHSEAWTYQRETLSTLVSLDVTYTPNGSFFF